jgi:hypothetical protein
MLAGGGVLTRQEAKSAAGGRGKTLHMGGWVVDAQKYRPWAPLCGRGRFQGAVVIM